MLASIPGSDKDAIAKRLQQEREEVVRLANEAAAAQRGTTIDSVVGRPTKKQDKLDLLLESIEKSGHRIAELTGSLNILTLEVGGVREVLEAQRRMLKENIAEKRGEERDWEVVKKEEDGE